MKRITREQLQQVNASIPQPVKYYVTFCTGACLMGILKNNQLKRNNAIAREALGSLAMVAQLVDEMSPHLDPSTPAKIIEKMHTDMVFINHALEVLQGNIEQAH